MEKNFITFRMVQKALNSFSKRRNNDFISLLVIREVTDAIQNQKFHPLKTVVLMEIYSTFLDTDSQSMCSFPVSTEEEENLIQKLKKVREYPGGQKALAIRSGISERTISIVSRKKTKITKNTWVKLNPTIDGFLADWEGNKELMEKQKHGKYTNYRKGCRCDECRQAWTKYIRELNHKKRMKNNNK